MRNINVLKVIYFIIGIIIYLYLSYQIIIFLNSVHRIERLPRVFMSAYRGPTVTISGNIIFKDYEKGFILIRVVTLDPKQAIRDWQSQDEIAVKKMPKPGPYQIRVPRKIGGVYIVASNIDREEKLEMLTPELLAIRAGEYPKNPLQVDTQDIKDIDLEISVRKP